MAGADGAIYRTRDGQLVRCHTSWWCTGQRYLVAAVPLNGRLVPRSVHRLVLLAWVGPAPKGKPQARHRDGDRANNRADNLLWGSPAENAIDRITHGTQPTKLKAWQVRIIRKRKHPARVYAARYGVGLSTIYAIFQGRSWRHLDGGTN